MWRATRSGSLVLVGSGLALVWAVALVRFRHWSANDDLAILQLHLERIGSGDVPLVGAYSRLDFHHPGPLREWLFGAAYWVSGRRSAALPATAVTLNLAWTLAAGRAGWRVGGRTGLIAGAAGALLLHVGMGWNLHSAWNPYLAVLAVYAAVWGVVEALVRGAAAWPLPVVAASFAAQQHVSLLPLGLVALAAVAVIVVRDRRRGSRTNPVWPALVTIVLWSGPLLDLARGGDSNLVRLLRNGGDGQPVGIAEAGRHVGRLVLPWSIAAGDALRATGLDTGSTVVGVAVAVVVALATALVVATPARRVALAPALGVVSLVWLTVAVGFAPPLFPYLFAPSVGALASVSALVLLAIVPVLRTRVPFPSRVGSPVAVIAAASVVLAWSVGGWSRMQPIATAPLQQQIDAAVRDAVTPGETYTIAAGGLVESVAHGEVALAVQQAGGVPRSDIFSLGLPAAITSDPMFVAAMGAPLACLLGRPGAPPPVVLTPSIASGLEVGVFLADDGTELELARFCLAS